MDFAVDLFSKLFFKFYLIIILNHCKINSNPHGDGFNLILSMHLTWNEKFELIFTV